MKFRSFAEDEQLGVGSFNFRFAFQKKDLVALAPLLRFVPFHVFVKLIYRPDARNDGKSFITRLDSYH